MNRFTALVTCSLVLACADTGQQQVAVPLWVGGTDVHTPITGRDGAQIELTDAQLAFGPLYLCAGRQAGDLCETAQLEWLESIVVEPLVSDPFEAGDLDGLTGTVRAWMYDLGITSLVTQPDPLVLPAAEMLGGASVTLQGTATVEDVTIPFTAAVAIRQSETTEIGIPVVRSAPSDAIDHEIVAEEAGLVLLFDAAPWVTDIDFAEVLDSDACAPNGDGCPDGVDLDPDGQAGRSIRNRIVAGPPPKLIWGDVP